MIPQPRHTRGPYRYLCRLEDMLALIAECHDTLDVCIAHARGLGHRVLLGELYRLQRQQEAAKYYICQHWEAESERLEGDNG
jgi:hypothetical protein